MTRDYLAQHSLQDVSPVCLLFKFKRQLGHSLVGDEAIDDGRRHAIALEGDDVKDVYFRPSELNQESRGDVIEFEVEDLERLEVAEVVENMRGRDDAAFLQCEVTEG